MLTMMAQMPILLALLLLWAPQAEAKLLQIIHTNDLHSHFEHAQDYAKGHYAAVKATIDRLKRDAQAQGIDTLTLDAGDFTEGTQFFLPSRGEFSWRLMDELGYDAVALGNHDYLMGQDELDRLLASTNPKFKLLCANFDVFDGLKHLKKHLKPYAEFKKSGARIAVVGLTTDEWEYGWRAGELVIDPPGEVLPGVLKRLRRKNDFVIALTHVGVDGDKQLAAANNVDLIVGGHEHRFLYDYLSVKNPSGRVVPIVQAGEHGEVVGDLLVDVTPGEPLRVVRYQLVPVAQGGPRDAAVDAHVAAARSELEREYGTEWLAEPIGYSEVPMTRPRFETTEWGDLVVEGMRNAVHADMALDTGDLFGDNQPAGPVTREKLFVLYPRVFDLGERFGWTVWTVHIYGWLLKIALEQALHLGFVFTISGATYDVTGPPGKEKIANLKIGNRPVKWYKDYTVALPEGIGRAADEMIELVKLALRSPTDSRIPVWAAVEAELVRLGGVVKPRAHQLRVLSAAQRAHLLSPASACH
ncbi:MAG: metallophosphoesterase [Deltaproteobacteria bacterium]|nr:metallophosphoesterase [Deltaproteobacteria bacterium]